MKNYTKGLQYSVKNHNPGEISKVLLQLSTQVKGKYAYLHWPLKS